MPATVVDGLRTIAAEAERHGVRVGIEPYQRDSGEQWTIATRSPEAVELIHEAGDPPALGIQFDVWHLWNTPTLFDDIAQRARPLHRRPRLRPREPTRGWADRALPGDGAADVPAILRALDAAGWDGLYDIEIFSDDGTFGSRTPTRFGPPRRTTCSPARESFARCWEATECLHPPRQ